MLVKHEYGSGVLMEHCTACKSMWYSSPLDRILKNIRQPYEAKLGRSIDIARCPDCTARLKTYERALREIRAHENGGNHVRV